MCGERFDAERFGRVVPAEKKIDAELFRGNCGPVRRFAGDEGIDLPAGALAKAGVVRGDAMNFAAGGASDDADDFCFWRTEVECFDRAA